MLAAGAVLVMASFAEALTDAQAAQFALGRLELIEVEWILANNRILSSYIRCMLRVGVCSPEARDFRKLTPRVLKDLCAECTDKQKANLRKIFAFVRKNRPDDWLRLSRVYDPDGSNKKRLEAFISGS